MERDGITRIFLEDDSRINGAPLAARLVYPEMASINQLLQGADAEAVRARGDALCIRTTVPILHNPQEEQQLPYRVEPRWETFIDGIRAFDIADSPLGAVQFSDIAKTLEKHLGRTGLTVILKYGS